MTTAAPTKLQVTLLVCPSCNHIGKRPDEGRFKGYCVGPEGDRHRKVRMVSTVFEAVS